MAEKRMLNNDQVAAHNLVPIKYNWAWELYKNGMANHWVAEEVSMAEDIKQWNATDVLTDHERHLIRRVMGFFSTAEGLVAGNLTLSVYRYCTNPETRQYVIRQALEEAVHSDCMLYIIQSLRLGEEETFGAYNDVPAIKNKDEFLMQYTNAVLDPTFSTATKEGAQTFLKSLIAFYIILEGISFYGGFAAIEAMRRQNKLPGLGQQFQYIARDESLHLAAGIYIINQIKEENPELWDAELQQWTIDTVKEFVELEKAYNREILPHGLVGFQSHQVDDYVEYIADRRLGKIDLPRQFHKKNPFPWMSESFDLQKEQNFFEGKVTDYSKAATLTW